jgi:hypothetical protein
MLHRDIDALMAGIAPVIGEYVAQAFAPLAAAVKALTDRVDALPPAPKLPEADEIRRMVDDAVASIPPAPAGKDADPALVEELVRAAVAALPQPKDGAPGASVTVEDLTPLVTAEVGKAVAQLPAPQPGRDADPEAVRELVKTHVTEAIAALPPPQPGPAGKDVDPAQLAAIVTDIVAGAVDALPKPQDGKSVTVEELAPLVVAEVGKAVQALPAQPVSLLVNEEGVLVAVYADGERKDVGKVRGADGARGASVMDGSIDADGALVLRISDGRELNVGIVRGKNGERGEPGAPGARGREALEIRILPGIDEARSYGEGVVARWRGGVIRAEKQTDPIVDGGDIAAAGWGVLLEGIAEETERELDDGRVIERTTVYTSGKVFTRQVTTAAPIDRGVWREGNFRKGDGVSYGGSWFIAKQDTAPTDKPGESDAWRLAVKRGRNGADGKLIAERASPIVRIP